MRRFATDTIAMLPSSCNHSQTKIWVHRLKKSVHASRVNGACMQVVLKSMRVIRVKGRVCQPCLNGDVHVELNVRVTR
jgi:hypothetical protein